MINSYHETIKQVRVELVGLGTDNDGGYFAAVKGLGIDSFGPTKVYGSKQIALPNGRFARNDKLVALIIEKPFAIPQLKGFLAIASK